MKAIVAKNDDINKNYSDVYSAFAGDLLMARTLNASSKDFAELVKSDSTLQTYISEEIYSGDFEKFPDLKSYSLTIIP